MLQVLILRQYTLPQEAPITRSHILPAQTTHHCTASLNLRQLISCLHCASHSHSIISIVNHFCRNPQRHSIRGILLPVYCDIADQTNRATPLSTRYLAVALLLKNDEFRIAKSHLDALFSLSSPWIVHPDIMPGSNTQPTHTLSTTTHPIDSLHRSLSRSNNRAALLLAIVQ